MLNEGTISLPLDGQLDPLIPAAQREHDHDEFELEKRPELEAALVRKVDRRMSILVLIYILNCKRT